MSKIIFTVLFAALPLVVYEAIGMWIIGGRRYGDGFIYAAAIIASIVFSLFAAYLLWRQETGKKKIVAWALVGALGLLTTLRLWNCINPAGQADILKRNYLSSIKEDRYTLPYPCSYNHFIDFFDENLHSYFFEDTAFIYAFAENCQLANTTKWYGGIADKVDYYKEYAAALFIFAQHNKMKPSDWLKKKHGDAVLLAMAFTETQERIEPAIKEGLLYESHQIQPGMLLPLEEASSESPYFHQGWIEMPDLRNLYRHYLQKDSIHQSELELLLYITSKIPATYINRQDYNRLVDKWKKYREPYKDVINLLQEQSSHMEIALRSLADNTGKLPVYYEGESPEFYWQPLLFSMGFEPVLDSVKGVKLGMRYDGTLLNEYEKDVYDYTTKTRQVYKKPTTKYGSGSYSTETYQEKVKVGTTTEQVFLNTFRFVYSMPPAKEDMDILMELPENPAYLYYDQESRGFTISSDFTSPDPSWFYSLPASYDNY